MDLSTKENDAATQVPSQDSEDKSHRSGHGISSLVRVATETFIASVHIDAFPCFFSSSLSTSSKVNVRHRLN